MGMWLASHERIHRYIKHPLWLKEHSLAKSMEIKNVSWGYAERSNGGLLLIDVPPGFQTSNVVPYNPEERLLLRIGQIRHLRNGYSRNTFGYSNIHVDDVFKMPSKL